jgi:hypothetical protein
MPIFHDAGMPEQFKRRFQALTPESRPTWGKMTVGQMLWHVCIPLAESLGEHTTTRTLPLPKFIARFMILYGPWGKGAPTRPDMLAKETRDFATEQARLLALMDRVGQKPMESAWPESANMGAMSGKQWSWLHYKHLDHHLRQFGV